MDLLRRYKAGTELAGLIKEHVAGLQQQAIVACAGRLVLEVQQEGVGTDNKENAGSNMLQAAYATPTKAASVPALATVENISMLTPRGKFNLSILEDGLQIINPKGQCFVPRAHVQDVVILDSFPKDTKGRVLLFVSLDKSSPVVMGKSTLDVLLIQTFADATLHVPQSNGEDLQGPSAVVLCQMLGMLGEINFISPDPDCFATTKGDTCLQATHKVSQGWLFPLPDALCYVERPAMLIPNSTISLVELQRIDRPSNTFDMVVHRHKPLPKVEFVQLCRAELAALQSYLSRSKLKTSHEDAAAAAQTGQGNGKATEGDAAEESDDSDDDEDEDFDPEGSSSGSEQDGDEGDEDEDQEEVHTEDLDKEDEQQEGGGLEAKQATKGTKRKVQEDDEEEDIAESDGEDEDEDEEDDVYETEDDLVDEDEQEEDDQVHAVKKAKQR